EKPIESLPDSIRTRVNGVDPVALPMHSRADAARRRSNVRRSPPSHLKERTCLREDHQGPRGCAAGARVDLTTLGTDQLSAAAAAVDRPVEPGNSVEPDHGVEHDRA